MVLREDTAAGTKTLDHLLEEVHTTPCTWQGKRSDTAGVQVRAGETSLELAGDGTAVRCVRVLCLHIHNAAGQASPLHACCSSSGRAVTQAACAAGPAGVLPGKHAGQRWLRFVSVP